MENKKLFESKYFDTAKQVKFLDLGDTNGKEVWHGGIAYCDDLICGCCGTVFSIAEIFEDWDDYGKKDYPNVEAPIEIFENWVDIDDEIIGE